MFVHLEIMKHKGVRWCKPVCSRVPKANVQSGVKSTLKRFLGLLWLWLTSSRAFTTGWNSTWADLLIKASTVIDPLQLNLSSGSHRNNRGQDPNLVKSESTWVQDWVFYFYTCMFLNNSFHTKYNFNYHFTLQNSTEVGCKNINECSECLILPFLEPLMLFLSVSWTCVALDLTFDVLLQFLSPRFLR